MIKDGSTTAAVAVIDPIIPRMFIIAGGVLGFLLY